MSAEASHRPFAYAKKPSPGRADVSMPSIGVVSRGSAIAGAAMRKAMPAIQLLLDLATMPRSLVIRPVGCSELANFRKGNTSDGDPPLVGYAGDEL